MRKTAQIPINPAFLAGALFMAGRLILLVSLPLEALQGYGDYWNFYRQAAMGLPFFDFWTEFPPLFPFLSRIIYLLTQGSEHAYTYALAVILSFIQAGSISIFYLLGDQLPERHLLYHRTGLYAFFTLGLFYSWGYFDALAVFFMLLGLLYSLKGRDLLSGLSVSAGLLAKWFPSLAAPAVIKMKDKRGAFRFLAALLILSIGVWGGLYLVSPEYTAASLTSQNLKGSWETIWALMDGNLRTGNFGAVDRTLLDFDFGQAGREAVISPWITLLIIGGLGFYLWIRTPLETPFAVTAFTGLTIVMFFLWSPGYSPQWVLYLLPMVLLVFPVREAGLWGLVLILINLLEWPLLLSRGMFTSLYWLIPLRTILYLLLGVRFYRWAAGTSSEENSREADLA